MHKQLRAIGELLKLDCGDNSCLAAGHKGGMRTNGGCRCDFVAGVQALLEAKPEAPASASASHESSVDLAALAEARRLAPPPFLAMQYWSPEAKSAAADFYQLAHDSLPALIAQWLQNTDSHSG